MLEIYAFVTSIHDRSLNSEYYKTLSSITIPQNSLSKASFTVCSVFLKC